MPSEKRLTSGKITTVINRNNAVLVHATTGIPDLFLRSGLCYYRDHLNGAVLHYTKQREMNLPSSIARQTIHFTLSHVVQKHTDYQDTADVAIIIPLSGLPDDLLRSFLGGPEDLFVFTSMLPLKLLGPITLLIPKSMVPSYKESKIKAVLGTGVKAIAYKGMSLSEAFISYAQERNLPYLKPQTFYTPGDSNSPVRDYTIVFKEKSYIANIEVIFNSLFVPGNILVEHSIHQLAHIESFLFALTGIIIMYPDNESLQLAIALGIIDDKNIPRWVFDNHPTLPKIYPNFEEFIGSLFKPHMSFVQNASPEIRAVILGSNCFPYYGRQELLDAFKESVLSIFTDASYATIATIVRQYHETVEHYLNTEPSLSQLDTQLESAFECSEPHIGPCQLLEWDIVDVPGDGNCFYYAVADQLVRIAPHLLQAVPETTASHTWLRAKVEGTAGFSDRRWASGENILEMARVLGIAIAVVDTRTPERGYQMYYAGIGDIPPTTPIIRLAFTGNHFLSIHRNPALTAGVLCDAFTIPAIRASDDDMVAGRDQTTGRPMMIEELHANAVSLGVSVVIQTLPEIVAGRRYLLVDSDNIVDVRNRTDIDVVHQDIQGNTASCGDNALITARKAQVAGFKPYIYVADGHAAVIIPYDAILDHTQILNTVMLTEPTEEDHVLWGKYVKVMNGNTLYLGNSTEALLQKYLYLAKIAKDQQYHAINGLGEIRAAQEWNLDPVPTIEGFIKLLTDLIDNDYNAMYEHVRDFISELDAWKLHYQINGVSNVHFFPFPRRDSGDDPDGPFGFSNGYHQNDHGGMLGGNSTNSTVDMYVSH